MDQMDYPVFIVCPKPGFKKSFFENSEPKIRNIMRVKDNVWKWVKYRNILLENVTSISNLYDEMSYELGVHWRLSILDDSVNDE